MPPIRGERARLEMAPPTALIVGAGIGGLAAGVALRRVGWRVRIFERAGSPRELGFALNLAGNALSALATLGVDERVMAEGSVIRAVEFRRENGKTFKRFTIRSDATERRSSVMALRPVLHGALLAATDGDALTLGAEVVGFAVDGATVSLHVRDGRSETGDLLIGADGIGSVIRRLLHPSEPPLRASGYYGIRGVAHGAAAALGNLDAVVYFGRGVEAATVRAGAESVYWYIAGRVAGAKDWRDPAAIVPRAAAALDDGFQAIVGATSNDDMRSDALYDREPMAEWGRGPVTLLGDAAHPMLPQTAQGAAQALEDAVALGLVLNRPADGMRALRRYEQVRAARTAPLQRRGRRLASVVTAESATIRWLLTTAIRLVPGEQIASAFLLSDGRDPHRALRNRAV
jgi:2-polyprenyl-6-methoxyphenol hydroxylase-like FAD-dependent oxidoreductase